MSSSAGAVLRSWLRRNLFSSVGNTLLTLISLYVIWIVFVPVVKWLFVDAYWQGVTPADCPAKAAACWPFIHARFDQFIYGFYPQAERWRINLGVPLGLVLIVPLLLPRFPYRFPLLCSLYVIFPCIGIFLFLGGHLGLPYVATSQWGGFFLTVVTTFFVLGTSLPLAIALALGRSASLPLLRLSCVAWIELWRSVPALVVLLVAIIMFPLFMPQGVEIDEFLRALLALTLLMSSYLAEAIRGALQAIPAGQYETADALGLNYLQKTFLVILPQAIPTALPQITSNFIGLFKETTILLVVGLFDLLGMVQTATSDPQWLSSGTSATGYVFTAFFFWVCCFGLSRYSNRLEKQTSRFRSEPQ